MNIVAILRETAHDFFYKWFSCLEPNKIPTTVPAPLILQQGMILINVYNTCITAA